MNRLKEVEMKRQVLLPLNVALLIFVFNLSTMGQEADKTAKDLRTAGIRYYDASDFENAIRQFKAALQLRPDYAEAHNDLGLSLAALKRYDEAIACLREAVRYQPNFGVAYVNLGVQYYE